MVASKESPGQILILYDPMDENGNDLTNSDDSLYKYVLSKYPHQDSCVAKFESAISWYEVKRKFYPATIITGLNHKKYEYSFPLVFAWQDLNLHHPDISRNIWCLSN